MNNFVEKVEQACRKNKIKFTEQRKIIAQVIGDSIDHPDAEKVFDRALLIDPNINLATVYRNINLFEEYGLLKKHYFRTQKARYELETTNHHDHIIDVDDGQVIEFHNNAINNIINQIANSMGYKTINYNLEIYATKKNK